MFSRLPEDGNRAGEDDDWAGAEPSAELQQRLGGAQVSPHSEVEVRFARGADGSGEVEDQVGIGERGWDGAGGVQQLTEVAADGRDSVVGRQVRWNWCGVDQCQVTELARAAARHLDR